MNILNSLCISYDDLKNSTKDIASLQETRRRQNERESLTNLTDSSFEFFMKLETLCRDKLTHTNLVHHGKSLFSNVIDELYKNTDLFELWVGTLTKNYVITYDTSGNVKTLEVFYIQLYFLWKLHRTLSFSHTVIFESVIQSIPERLPVLLKKRKG